MASALSAEVSKEVRRHPPPREFKNFRVPLPKPSSLPQDFEVNSLEQLCINFRPLPSVLHSPVVVIQACSTATVHTN